MVVLRAARTWGVGRGRAQLASAQRPADDPAAMVEPLLSVDAPVDAPAGTPTTAPRAAQPQATRQAAPQPGPFPPGRTAAATGTIERPRREQTGWDPAAPGFVAGAATTMVAALLLVFVADLLVVGHIRHARDQQTAFADLRVDLANGTAIVNQTTDTGALQRPGAAVGVIEIPQIGVREVFFEGTTAEILMSGPGHRRDTPMPGQAGTSVIMGRKAGFGGPFNYLSELQPQSVFWVWTGQGRSAYRVTGVRRAGDPQPQPLAAGQGRLTLVTATGSDYMPTGVLRVDAVLVRTHTEDPATAAATPQPSGPRPLTAVLLPVDERAMRGEPSAWLGLFGWAVALWVVAMAVAWARLRWGRWQTWLSGAPALFAVGLALSQQLARLLPNLL